MKKMLGFYAFGLAAALCAVLGACGGGSGSSAAGASSAGATSASGTLTAFGSVFVNGAEYATSSATSVVDGDADDAASSAAALRVGMTLDVTASGGTANLLRYTSAVRGEIDAIDAGTSTLTVLGQTVVVSSGTEFAGSATSGGTTTPVSSLANLGVGDYVVVYGYLDCTNSTSTSSCTGGATRVLASLIYEPSSAGVYRVEGYAENVSSSAGTFTINGLTVATTSSTVCTPSPCAVSAGDFLEVRGASAPTASGSTLTLTATRVKSVSFAPVLVAGETASIEGPVDDLDASADTFYLRGISVDASALPSTVAGLADGQIVIVTGTVNSSGGLTASAITVEHRATFTLVGPVTALSASADTLTVLGQTFTVDSATRFDDLADNVRPFNLSNFASVLSTGDTLLVSAYTTSAGNIATRVVRLPPVLSGYVAAEGVVSADSASADTLTIGGVTITLDSSTVLRYPNSGSTPTLAGFFDAVTVGTTVVGVYGTAGSTSGTISATGAIALAANCGWASTAF